MNGMDRKDYSVFYYDSLRGYSKGERANVVKWLTNKGCITFEQQMSINDDKSIYFADSKDVDAILKKVSENRMCAKWLEYYEYVRLYKYSVPFFYEVQGDKIDIMEIISNLKSANKHEEFDIDKPHLLYLPAEFNDDNNFFFFKEDDEIYIKFVMQKHYTKDETDVVNYRYAIIIVIDVKEQIIDIRFDNLKYTNENNKDLYGINVSKCIKFLKKHLRFTLKSFKDNDLLTKIKNDESGEVKIYKQMMEMKSGGAAELTASEDRDYMLPFIGEIRELISENEQLFSQHDEIKVLLENYLLEKEMTASYPYIYLKWVNSVATRSYTEKIIFDYFNNKHMEIQHMTNGYYIEGRERIRNVIRFLCESKAFIDGEEV